MRRQGKLKRTANSGKEKIQKDNHRKVWKQNWKKWSKRYWWKKGDTKFTGTVLSNTSKRGYSKIKEGHSSYKGTSTNQQLDVIEKKEVGVPYRNGENKTEMLNGEKHEKINRKTGKNTRTNLLLYSLRATFKKISSLKTPGNAAARGFRF